MAGRKGEFSLYRVLREQQTVRPVEPEPDIPHRPGLSPRRARCGRSARRSERLSVGRGRDGRARDGDRLEEAGVPPAGRLPALGRERGLSAQPDGVHRPPDVRLGVPLLHLDRRAARSGHGARPLAGRLVGDRATPSPPSGPRTGGRQDATVSKRNTVGGHGRSDPSVRRACLSADAFRSGTVPRMRRESRWVYDL